MHDPSHFFAAVTRLVANTPTATKYQRSITPHQQRICGCVGSVYERSRCLPAVPQKAATSFWPHFGHSRIFRTCSSTWGCRWKRSGACCNNQIIHWKEGRQAGGEHILLARTSARVPLKLQSATEHLGAVWPLLARRVTVSPPAVRRPTSLGAGLPPRARIDPCTASDDPSRCRRPGLLLASRSFLCSFRRSFHTLLEAGRSACCCWSGCRGRCAHMGQECMRSDSSAP